MTQNYITLSLETHLFFSRIMKEHALFLEAGFPCKNTDWIQTADGFRQKFESLLLDVVKLSDGIVNCPILESNELVTEFTIPAERQTQRLSGVSIDSEISKMESQLRCGSDIRMNRQLQHAVHQINRRSLFLLN